MSFSLNLYKSILFFFFFKHGDVNSRNLFFPCLAKYEAHQKSFSRVRNYWAVKSKSLNSFLRQKRKLLPGEVKGFGSGRGLLMTNSES